MAKKRITIRKEVAAKVLSTQTEHAGYAVKKWILDLCYSKRRSKTTVCDL